MIDLVLLCACNPVEFLNLVVQFVELCIDALRVTHVLTTPPVWTAAISAVGPSLVEETTQLSTALSSQQMRLRTLQVLSLGGVASYHLAFDDL